MLHGARWVGSQVFALSLLAAACGPARPSLEARANSACGTRETLAQCQAVLDEADARIAKCESAPKTVYWKGCGAERRLRVEIAARVRRMEASAATPTAATADVPPTKSVTSEQPRETNEPGREPTPEQVQNAAVAAAIAAPSRCGVHAERAVVGASIEIKPTGEIADVAIRGVVATPPMIDCLKKSLAELKFSPFSLPADAGADWRHDPSGTRFPIYICTRSFGTFTNCRAALFEVTLMLGVDGSAMKPTREQLRAFDAESKALAVQASDEARSAACAETKASAMPPGTYSGDASQTITANDGSKVRAWKSLTITIDDAGCVRWRGYEAGDISMPGDRARNLDTIASTCINEGTATITKTGSGGFRMKAAIVSKSAGGAPTRFHVWKCPGLGNVQTSLSADLRPQGCLMLGNAADAREERVSAVVCAAGKPFDELLDRTFTIDREGSIRLPLTIADPATIVLRRIDSKR